MQVKIAKYTMLFFAFVTLMGCGGKKDEVPVVEIDNSYIRFFEELGRPDSTLLMEVADSLTLKYPYFFRLYTEGVLKLGEVSDRIFPKNLYQFIENPVYTEVLDTVEKKYSNTDDIEHETTLALARLKSLFPGHETPDVYWMISVFNEAIVVGDKLVAVSLEHYLGNRHYFYEQLGTYRYLQAYKIKKRIPIDILDGWNRTDFLLDASTDRLLDDMLYEGRLLYLLSQLFPAWSVEDLMGYTDGQKNWIQANEASVWTYIVEQKQLFETDQAVKRTYIGEAPYTSFFGNQSPSRIGRYVGFKIVEGYMKNVKNATIPALFKIKNAQDILQGSQYNP